MNDSSDDCHGHKVPKTQHRFQKGIIVMRTSLCIAAIFLTGTAPGHAQDGDQQRPNILFIAVDDLNDWVGCLGGHPQAFTPNIDRLAQSGTLFTNAHCQGPICGPSRACLLSGKYPTTTGIYQQPSGKAMTEDTTHFRGHLLPEYFAEHGYTTLAVGKICHGYPDNLAFHSYGGKWDNFGPKPPNGFRFNYHLPDVPFTGTQTDWGAFPDTDSKMPDHKSAEWAIQQLQKRHDKPFFLATGFIRPHVPFYVPEKWFDRFPLESVELPKVRNDDLNDVPPISRAIHELPKYPNLKFLQQDDSLQFRKCVQAYLACTTFVDYQIGRVLNVLNNSKYADNTIIILFSDHGYHLGEKDRVAKHSLWEESTRVPLIIVQPGHSHANLVHQPVGLIDIYPTILELCGLPAKATNEGRSLVPLINDPNTEWRTAIRTTYARGNHALRSDRYRYIRFEDGSEELYDHQTDPNEWNNLAGQPESLPTLEKFRKQLPEQEAPYHRSTNKGPVNQWFLDHLKNNRITR